MSTKQWAMIATWRMALDGVEKGTTILKNKGTAGDAIETAIKDVEDNPYYKSVGYGGLPNELGVVELDAAYMDGSSMDIGMVAAVEDIKNPISLARHLSKLKVNNMLVGKGARDYAIQEGFEIQEMLSDRAEIFYQNKVKEQQEELKPYIGHDTVGMVSLDTKGNMVSATSTSGLFMKKTGRVGDSPIIGSGFYVDSEAGGAATTGLGEDMMKGIVAYEIVRLLQEGYHPQLACEKVCFDLDAKLRKVRGSAGDISLVAIDNKGNWGAASNIDTFSFVVANQDMAPTVYITKRDGDKMIHEKASQQWIDDYITTRTAPVKKL